jgi:hypothetical protein
MHFVFTGFQVAKVIGLCQWNPKVNRKFCAGHWPLTGQSGSNIYHFVALYAFEYYLSLKKKLFP